MSDPRFAKFWETVTETISFEEETDIMKKTFEEAFLKACGAPTTTKVSKADTKVSKAVTKVTKGHRGVSGWNLYMKNQMAALKEEIPSGSDRLKQIGATWKTLTTEDKAVWNDQAKSGTVVDGSSTTVPPAKAPTKKSSGEKRGVSGWTLYMKDQMAALKEQYPSGSDRLKAIGATWKTLSHEDKDVWNAKTTNGKTDE